MAKLALALLAAPAVAFNFGGGGGAPARAAVDTTATVEEPATDPWKQEAGQAAPTAESGSPGQVATTMGAEAAVDTPNAEELGGPFPDGPAKLSPKLEQNGAVKGQEVLKMAGVMVPGFETFNARLPTAKGRLLVLVSGSQNMLGIGRVRSDRDDHRVRQLEQRFCLSAGVQ